MCEITGLGHCRFCVFQLPGLPRARTHRHIALLQSEPLWRLKRTTTQGEWPRAVPIGRAAAGPAAGRGLNSMEGLSTFEASQRLPGMHTRLPLPLYAVPRFLNRRDAPHATAARSI